MTGPCLCGDPCCPSCGSPSQCKYEEAIEMLVDRLYEANLSEAELIIFEKVGFAAVEVYKEASKIDIDNAVMFEALANQHEIDRMRDVLEKE